MPAELGETLAFLRDLRVHNDRAWFEANRERYELARSAFLSLVASVLELLGEDEDLGGIGPEDCAFRIYRDVRFSKDKSPYKPNMGALMGREGRGSATRGYYLHVEPDGHSFLGGGLYQPSPAELASVRASIAADPSPLKRLISDPAFERLFGHLSGESLKTAPQGYPKDHPEIGLLRLKQYVVVRGLADEELLSPRLALEAAETYRAMRPFLACVDAMAAGRAGAAATRPFDTGRAPARREPGRPRRRPGGPRRRAGPRPGSSLGS
jgi:uncharacterized protein (TIGR02453 family)